MRVFEFLSNTEIREKLRHCIPRELISVYKTFPKHKYPQKLIKILPNTYSDFGIISETLLKKKAKNIHLQKIVKESFNIDLDEDLLNLKSTQIYLENLNSTRRLVRNLAQDEELLYDIELTLNNISGHPDIMTENHIFEVKTSGNLSKSWTMYLLQTFCYAALNKNAKHIHIVLPLQNYVWSFDLQDWKKRDIFTKIIEDYAPETLDNKISKLMVTSMLNSEFNIGTHIERSRGIYETLKNIQTNIPLQLFLSKKSFFKIEDEEIAKINNLVTNKNLNVFVHAPYILNLSSEELYIRDSMTQQLTVAKACGFKGVVIHTGKYVKRTKEEGILNMKNSVLAILENSSEECPLLIETAAGQGTELFPDPEDLMKFVRKINDKRLGICLDTCHVYSAGYDPSEFLQKCVKKNWIKWIKLIHFNDSCTEFGSCKDRHAVIGTGSINVEIFLKIAYIAQNNNIFLLTE